MVRKPKVLIIDDEANVTYAIGRILSVGGYEVITLNDPFKVDDYILYTDIDLVITDLKMPGRDGLEVLKIFRLSRPNVPVMILTGHGGIDSAVEATKLGAAEYLSKPIRQDELTKVVGKYAKLEEHMPSDARKVLAELRAAKKQAETIDPEKIVLPYEIVSTDTIPAGFVEVEFEAIVPGETIPFSLFIQIYNKNDHCYYLRKLCEAQSVYTVGLRNMLFRRRLGSVYIQDKDYRAYLKYYSGLKADPRFQGEQLKDKKKLVLYGKAVEAVAKILAEPVGPANVKEGVELVDEIFQRMVKDPDLFQDMYKLFQKDTNIFNHSSNVCLLVVSFGLFLKLKPEAIKILGVGSLFHDVGMSKVSKEILEKSSPLTKLEWEEIKKHPTAGVAVLKQSLLCPPQAQRMVQEHHEKDDGSGYPQNLTAAKILDYSRICRIVDCFDGLTTAKPYRGAFTPVEAAKQIYTEATSDRSKALVVKFVRFLSGRKGK